MSWHNIHLHFPPSMWTAVWKELHTFCVSGGCFDLDRCVIKAPSRLKRGWIISPNCRQLRILSCNLVMHLQLVMHALRPWFLAREPYFVISVYHQQSWNWSFGQFSLSDLGSGFCYFSGYPAHFLKPDGNPCWGVTRDLVLWHNLWSEQSPLPGFVIRYASESL